jgi:hypothetical protein
MNTAIDFHRAEPEATPTVSVDAAGTLVVIDGDAHDARALPEQFTVCFCSNNRHHDAQHDAWGMHATEGAAEREAAITGGHLLARELFSVTRVVKR